MKRFIYFLMFTLCVFTLDVCKAKAIDKGSFHAVNGDKHSSEWVFVDSLSTTELKFLDTQIFTAVSVNFKDLLKDKSGNNRNSRVIKNEAIRIDKEIEVGWHKNRKASLSNINSRKNLIK